MKIKSFSVMKKAFVQLKSVSQQKGTRELKIC